VPLLRGRAGDYAALRLGEAMTQTSSQPRCSRPTRALLALFCAALLVPGEGALLAQAASTAPAQAAAPPAKIPPDKLDSLVAPVALYPDPLLAQTLVAATYPLELMQLQQWLAKNKGLKDKALADAVAKQPWDPAIQSMAPLPDVVKRLCDDIQWTTDLGNAFLDQQKDVMDAVQRMRKKAQDKGALKTNEQQKVETQVVESKTVIVVQPSNPEVIYVPVYSPTVVYPPPVYPYPPIYYPPPPPPGAAFMTFTAGVIIGAAVWGGSCCGCGWGHNDVNINVNNNFNRNTNINTGGNNNWQHNSAHRGGAPYSNQATANKYGGSTKGGAAGRQSGASAASRGGASPSASTANRGGGAGASPNASTANRGGGAGASPSASTANRSGGAGASPSASASKSSGALGGGSGGYSGSSAKSSSSRGASSMSSGSRGGGGRSGGGRR
jgi:hypothetical protein